MSEFIIKRVEAGKEVLVNVSNRKGMEIVLSNLGASLRSCKKPGRELTLGYAEPDSYRRNPVFLATTVGRFANRIAKGRCAVDGKHLELEINNDPNHLHGGSGGFHSRYWDCAVVEGTLSSNDRGKTAAAGACFTLESADGDQGYPGSLSVRVAILLSADNQLCFFYQAAAGAPTVVNLTNHTYWNLQGENGGTVHKHRLRLSSKGWLEVDAGSIPTGRLVPMKGAAWDFGEDRELGPLLSDPELRRRAECQRGIDHCFVLDPALPQMDFSFQAKGGAPLEQAGKVRFGGRLSAPESPSMEFFTSLPGVQLYTGNNLDDLPGRNGGLRLHAGVCLETQLFPDCPNQAAVFRSIGKRVGWPEAEMARWDALVQPGKPYQELTVHRFI